MINKCLPDLEDLTPLMAQVRTILEEQGHTDVVAAVIANMKRNAEMQAKQGVDAWLAYGVYLPAVERIIALHSGEEEADFLERTQYPVNVIEAYTVKDDDLATLLCADQFSQFFKRTIPKNTSEWCLNDDEQYYIDLNQFENRLRAI